MKTNLAKILWMKEKKHWKRLGQMFKKFNDWFSKLTFGLIVAILLIIIHYCFVLMHTLYETLLFVVARKAFKANIQRMALTI